MARCDSSETIPYIIRCPDYRIFQVNVAENALGKECVNRICDIMGTLETDYFSLCFTIPAGRFWINKRINLRRQLKLQKPPYLLDLRVKYYVDPDNILQSTTRELFFHQLKLDMLEGVLPVPPSKTGWIGALLAQVQMGDCPLSLTNRLIYPQYFSQWDLGVPRKISMEHKKLKGFSREHVVKLFVDEASKLDKYGARSFRAKVANEAEEDDVVSFFVGGKCVIVEYENKPNQRIPYHVLMEASYDSSKFKVKFRAITNGEPDDVLLTLKTSSSKQAHLIFRTLTEDHTYFTQASVSDRVLEHFELERLSKLLRASITNKKLDKRYHFDVVRTVSESFQFHWRKLHQFALELRTIDTEGQVREEADQMVAEALAGVVPTGDGPPTALNVQPGNVLSVLAAHFDQHVEPSQPSLERIQSTIAQERSSPLQRWRAGLRRRRQRPSTRLTEPEEDCMEESRQENECEPDDVTARMSLLPDSTSTQELPQSSSTSTTVVPSTDLDTAAVVSAASCVSEMEETMADNPIPLWMSFSPSVQQFITEVLGNTPTSHPPTTPTRQPPTIATSQPSDTSVSTALSGDSIRSMKKNSLAGPSRVKSNSGVVALQPASQHIVPGCCIGAPEHGGEHSNSDTASRTEKPRDLVKEKKQKKGKKNKDSQVLVAGLPPSSLKIVKPVIERINDNFTCKVCMDRFVNTAFCPCGHYITCRQCADMLMDCPVCRTTIAHTMLIYQ